jgi:Fe-S-cluster-containing dehydrogenase component
MRYGKVIDGTRCIGCHACTTACKSENEVPLGVTRTYVKYVEQGAFPQVRRAFQVTRCNQCDDAPCVTACPTKAMHRRPDGIVDVDRGSCIGCKACMAACPYDAIFMNPATHVAEKCNFCAHRIDVGLEPACVVVCPTQAIIVGDLDDADSPVARIVGREPVSVRRPEKGTRPKLFYVATDASTLDPLAAARPAGGLTMWSEQGDVPHAVPSGHPDGPQGAAAALLAYDVPHRAPWDWRVSLYTWTKGIAAGAYLAPAALVATGVAPASSTLWRHVAPAVALAFLVLTALVLVLDLEQPRRFLYVLTRPNWSSWLARGAVILAAYGAFLVAHLALGAPRWSIAVGAPLAAAAAAYTAFLFAQATARDLWQSPLAAPHLLVQALLLGAAVAEAYAPARRIEWLLAAAAAGHVVLVLCEVTTPHATAHAHLAVRELVRGRDALAFRAGLALVAASALAPAIGRAGVPLALAGVLLYEHAYVQAGQSVPLA